MWEPGDPGAPRQTTEEGAEGRREGGGPPVVFACRCWRKKRGSYKPHQLGKTSGHSVEGCTPILRAKVWSTVSPPTCGGAERGEGDCTSNQCLSLQGFETVPKGWSWGLPAVGAMAQARAKLYLSDLTRYRSTRYASSRKAKKKMPKTRKSM